MYLPEPGLRVFDQRRWEDSRETVHKRKPVAGDRTRTRLKQRHVHGGLKIDKPAPPTAAEIASMTVALLPDPPATRRPARVFTSADMPDLPADASLAEADAWDKEYQRRAIERTNALLYASKDPYASPMGDGPTTRTVRTHDGLRVIAD